MIQWQSSLFSNLTLEDLYEILRARQEVFVLEQNCPFLDADGLDKQSWHVWAWERNNQEQVLLAYSRIVAPGGKYSEPSIGRVLTTNAGRGRGLGRELMKRSVLKAEELYAIDSNSSLPYSELHSFGFQSVNSVLHNLALHSSGAFESVTSQTSLHCLGRVRENKQV